MDSPSSVGSSYAGEGFTDAELANFYQRTSGHIAFIDESYRSPNQDLGVGNNTYYLLTAVVIRRTKVATVRARLLEIAGARKWHTTKEAQTAAGREKVLEMCRYLAQHSMSIVAVETKIETRDRDAEQARAACMETLFQFLCANILPDDGLVVYERRQAPQQPADRATVHRLRSRELIHPNLIVHPGSPATEALLWAPDIVAWATRRVFAEGRTEYVEPLKAAKHFQILTVKKT